MLKNECFVTITPGLGDQLMCNGLIRHLLKTYEKINIPVLDIYKKSVQFMYSDIRDRLNFIYINVYGYAYSGIGTQLDQIEKLINIYKEKCEIIYSAHFKNNLNSQCIKNVGCISFFYQNCSYDHNIAYTKFKVDRNIEKQMQLLHKLDLINKDYSIVIQDFKRNMLINQNYYVNNNNVLVIDAPLSKNVFDYCSLFCNATEIHTIPSSLSLLIQFLQLNENTYVHNYTRISQSIMPYIYKNLKVVQ